MAERPSGSEIKSAYDGITAAILLIVADIRRWWQTRKEQHEYERES